MTRVNIMTMLATAITLVGLCGTTAQAAPAGFDWFSSTTTPQTKTTKTPKAKPLVDLKVPVRPTNSTSSADQNAAAIWFEKFEELRDQYHPSAADRVILSRPLMREEERVNKWTATASKISRNYLLCVSALKQLAVPAQLSDLREYRDLTADWYHDAACVFDEMIRPRTPAKTIEELQRQLDSVAKQSATLTTTASSLAAMDRDLRKRYKVELSGQNDELQKYVSNK